MTSDTQHCAGAAEGSLDAEKQGLKDAEAQSGPSPAESRPLTARQAFLGPDFGSKGLLLDTPALSNENGFIKENECKHGLKR